MSMPPADSPPTPRARARDGLGGWIDRGAAALGLGDDQRRAAFARDLGLALFFAWLALLYALHVLATFGGATIDDAAITYAYADNLARGHGLRLTPGEAPTEGFSNFLQVLLIAPFARLGDLDRVAKWLNVGAVAVALFALARFAAARLEGWLRWVPALLFLLVYTWPGFNYWIAAGLEGGLLAALQITSLLGLAAASRRGDLVLGGAAGLLAWTRPEGAVHGALALGGRLLAGRGWSRPLAIFAGALALLVALRFALFRDLVPNTYWAKVTSETARESGLAYVDAFLRARASYLWCALPVLAGYALRLRPAAIAAWAQLGFGFYFAVHAGGDWMKEFRFIQPVMGPLIVLQALGLVAVLERRGDPTENPPGRRATVVLALAFPVLLWLALGGHEMPAKISAQRDVDMRKLAVVAAEYKALGERLALPRRPLIADVDVGGVSFASGLDVLDLGGLGDRVLSRAWTRESGRVVDYVFGERRPDTIHLHGSWNELTPLDRLSPFAPLYRELGDKTLHAMALGPMTAIRADHADPPAAPAVPSKTSLAGAELQGLTAIPSQGGYLLVLHARHESGEPTVVWKGAGELRVTADWHAGLDVEVGPVGAPLVATARLPATALPLALEGTSVRLERWPVAFLETGSLAGLSRVPFFRRAGESVAPCDPTPVLDPDAPAAARVRGAALVARLCGAPPPALGHRLAAEARAVARAADASADDRYEAAVAVRALSPPGDLADRLAIEDARRARQPYDEILLAFAERELAVIAPTPEVIERGLSLLLAARQFEELLLRALAFGWTEQPRARGAICAAAGALGLRAGAVTPSLACGGARAPVVKVLRQSFEDALPATGGAAGWRASSAGKGQPRVVGGQGGWFLHTGLPGEPGELVWGPLPFPGRRFGVLVGGGGPGVFSGNAVIRIEEKMGDTWTELWKSERPRFARVLTPQLVDLPDRRGQTIRVRVTTDGPSPPPLLVDALTFVDLP